MGANCCRDERAPGDGALSSTARPPTLRCACIRHGSSTEACVEECEAEPEPDDVFAEDCVPSNSRGKVSAFERFQGALEVTVGHSHGTWNTEDGTSYEGQMYRGLKQGRGVMVHQDGTVFSGLWQAGEKCGAGIETWADGTEYDGEFFKGLKHGHGVYRSSNGGHYTGQFRYDRMEGAGRFRFAGGRVYTGQWQEGAMLGSGAMEFPDGSRFEGFYEAGARSGFGSLAFADGRSYAGQWVEGKLEGPGVVNDASGKEWAVEWQGNGSYVALDEGIAELGHAEPREPSGPMTPRSEGAPGRRWKVLAPVNVRSRPDSASQAAGTMEEGDIVFGEVAGEWLQLDEEAGYIALAFSGRQLLVPADDDDGDPQPQWRGVALETRDRGRSSASGRSARSAGSASSARSAQSAVSATSMGTESARSRGSGRSAPQK
mmetsp:Transcript_172816/g.554003  ORF Transcript_172816/g.554003 Transcript_172816/m.554003 type:complete len:430 (-) Transcript_172816:21-1310(-)